MWVTQKFKVYFLLSQTNSTFQKLLNMHISNTHYSSYHRKLPYVLPIYPILLPYSRSRASPTVSNFFLPFKKREKAKQNQDSLFSKNMFRYFLKEILVFVILVKDMNVEARTLLSKFGKIYEDMDYPFYRQLPQGTENCR